MLTKFLDDYDVSSDDYFNPSTVIWPESQTIEFDFSLSPGESEKVSMDMKLRRSAKESTNLYFFYIDGHWYLTGLRTNLSTNDQLTSGRPIEN